MKPALIDTDVLSRFFRGHGQVVKRFGDYTAQYDIVTFSIVSARHGERSEAERPPVGVGACVAP
ncbi:PIN domain-containing protein [Thiocapsa bogorovii]|uniref:hypothetical protein n=1 Tax=Thiocapsa bogorovii TaxID=521689 RepID=UPI001E298995|nr:hypothetical protein [Thiocapsa bogorovii]UHD17006.1 hypothetical protein LT988_02800 [Thiocapsa bogorovii]